MPPGVSSCARTTSPRKIELFRGCCMVLRLVGMLLIFGLCWGVVLPASAATNVDLSLQPAVEVPVSLGTVDNQLRFVPQQIQLDVGRRYKLVLTNPSQLKHYFTAKDFADGVWSQKVVVGGVEVKGAIHELELKPASEAAWFLVPVKAGSYELHCSIPGHAEAGMVGSIKVVSTLS